MFCSVLLNRLREHVASRLREEQAGFRRGRSCSEQIFTLRTIIAQSLEHQTPLIINFIDFKNAFHSIFDSIHRESLWKILKRYGVPDKFINIFKTLYLNLSVTIGEQELARVEHAKMLGVTISNNLTWSKHVDNIVSKAGKRVYMLYQLKRAGISQTDLVKIYVSIIRPVLEYACPVWSTSLPTYLSDAIEMIQKHVLRSIHPGLHYDDILVLVGLQSLKKRRDNICKAYFNRLKRNTHRLNHLIPERRDVHYSLRNANVYPIPVQTATKTRLLRGVCVTGNICT